MRTDRRRAMKAVFAAGVFLSAFRVHAAARAAPKADLWERWLRHDPDAALRLDHKAWQDYLDARLETQPDGTTRLTYDRRDLARIETYLSGLERVPVDRLNRDEQFAFWVNLYNALTVRVMLAHGPVESIRDVDISPGLFADGPWGAKLIAVARARLSLDDIEHRILRPIWKDPRIHYVVNCASIGCPDLPKTAFTGKNRDRLLDAAARRYVNHRRAVRVVGGRAAVSSLYHWYRGDFGARDADLIGHLKRYAAPALARALDGVDDIGDGGYDWALNGVYVAS